MWNARRQRARKLADRIVISHPQWVSNELLRRMGI
jgi:hypothetical protein